MKGRQYQTEILPCRQLPTRPARNVSPYCVKKKTCFLWGHSHSEWKPTHALDQFFQLWKKTLKHPLIGIPQKPRPAIMMMMIALVIAAMQLLLSLIHLQSLLRIDGVLRTVLILAFENNQLTKVNPTGGIPFAELADGGESQVWEEEKRPDECARVHQESWVWVRAGEILKPGPGRDSPKLWHSD